MKGFVMPNRTALIIIFLLSGIVSFAQENERLTVDEIYTCTAIEDMNPLGVNSTFKNDVKRVYCFTKISGAEESTTITHVWYHEGIKRAKQHLSVEADSWRTWSSKKIVPRWHGKWRIDVLKRDGTLIESIKFTVEPPDTDK
jgi:hypothetical protein